MVVGAREDARCRGVWDWGASVRDLTKELSKDKVRGLRVTRARDRSVDTPAFTFLREHVKGTRARLERVRSAAKQCISRLQQQSENACAWAAELEALAGEHWHQGAFLRSISMCPR